MRERATRFGRTATMVGIVAEPDGLAAIRPGVVMLNSGILHRVGACRLHVQLARALAADGVTSLRFDFSGIGDSEARRDALSFEESAVIETREAMDQLTTTKGVSQFVLFGLCSGADMAYHVALQDERVVGLVLLDAWAYRTWQFYLNHYGKRICDLSAWRRYVANRLGRAVSGGLPQQDQIAGTDETMPRYVRVFPPRLAVEAGLRRLADRGLRFLYVFSGGQSEHFNYRRQFEDAFDGVEFGGRLQVHYLAEADHIFTRLEHQRFVVNSTVKFLADWPAHVVLTAAVHPPRAVNTAPLTVVG